MAVSLRRLSMPEMDWIVAPAHCFCGKHGFVALDDTDGSGNAECEPDVLHRCELA